MHEVDVAGTDYLLALEGLFFVALLVWRWMPGPLHFWLTIYFAAASVASACGGTVHGFFHDERADLYAILWRVTMLAVGVATLATWAIGASLLASQRLARWVMIVGAVQLAAYCIVVLFLTQDFRLAVADNLPALLFLMLALALSYRRQRRAGLFVAAGGLSLTLLAGALQQLQISVHPVYFNHNAVFHVVQAVAMLLFFLGCRSLVAADPGGPNAAPAEVRSSAVGPNVTASTKAGQGDSRAHTP